MIFNKVKSFILVTILVLTIFLPQISAGQKRIMKEETPPIDAKMKAAVIDSVNKALIETYIFLDTAEKMVDFTNEKLKNGEYDDITDAFEFTQILTKDFQTVSKDKHLHIRFAPERAEDIMASQSQSEEEAEKAYEKRIKRYEQKNFGFEKVEHLQGNIGYVDFRQFASVDIGAPTAIAAMNFLANSNAIIIDLRQNGGGSPSMIQLLSSYFLEEPTHLNSFEVRSENQFNQFWTLPYVPGKKMYDTDLYILTSKYTFSGAEEFTYNMKNLERATIIGETTGGGAHPVSPQVIHDEFVLSLPFGRAVNPITKTNWEGVGIEPHIAVPQEQALNKAHLMALEKLLEKEEDENVKFQLTWAIDGLKAKFNPVEIDEKTLEKYAGDYGERKVWLENGELFYQRTGPKIKLIPMSETMFYIEEIGYFRIEFTVDKNGTVIELVGLYDNGMREPSKRIK